VGSGQVAQKHDLCSRGKWGRGGIWVVFAGGARMIDSLTDKVLLLFFPCMALTLIPKSLIVHVRCDQYA
jgi:hypothetical protein